MLRLSSVVHQNLIRYSTEYFAMASRKKKQGKLRRAAKSAAKAEAEARQTAEEPPLQIEEEAEDQLGDLIRQDKNLAAP